MDETSEALIARIQQLPFDVDDPTAEIAKAVIAMVEMIDAMLAALEVLSARMDVLERRQTLRML